MIRRIFLAAAALAGLAAACTDDAEEASAELSLPEAGAPAPEGVAPAETGAPPAVVDADAGPDAEAEADASAEADAAPLEEDDGGPLPADLFDPAFVPVFKLTIDDANLAILRSTAPADEKTWVHGTFTYGTETVLDVGIRRKGSSTFRVYPQKMAIKIRFDKWVDDQRFHGLTDLTLNNAISDPTFLAERLSYHVFRSLGLPAQRANSAEVRINGESFGLYVNVETPNQDLLGRLYGANAKTLYECEYGSAWKRGEESGFSVEVGPKSKADLLAMFDAVTAAAPDTLLADVQPKLDTAQWLRFSAAEAATGHTDGYAYGVWGSHNYFVAGDASGVFTLLPWSTDLSFTDRYGAVRADHPRNFAPPPNVNDPSLLMRCKTSTTCWPTYVAAVSAVLDAFESYDLVNLAKTWNAQIDARARADAKKETSTSDYLAETTKLYAWLAARPAVVRQQLGLPPKP